MTITEIASGSISDARSPLGKDQQRILRSMINERLRVQHVRAMQAAEELDAFSVDDSPADREVVSETLKALLEGERHLELAVARFDLGDYGMCDTCALPIPFERLEAIPDAVHCVSCTRIG